MRKLFFVLLAVLLVSGCGGRKSNAAVAGNAEASLHSGDSPQTDSLRLARKFRMPEVPASLATPEAQASYVVEHYWDKFDFMDEDYLKYKGIIRSVFGNFAGMLFYVPQPEAETALVRMMTSAERNKNMFDYFIELSEDCFYNPVSNLRNDEFYIPVLRYVLESDKLDEVEKIRPRAHLEMALKNRVGHKADDIVYTTADGKTGRLYNIRSAYTLLFINNPDCPACAMIIADLKSSEVVGHLLASGQLTILAVYPDKDLEAWHNHRGDIPANWINGYDAGQIMDTRRTYDLKAIPTLYLMDKDKTVLIKDADAVYPVERYLMANM